MYTLMSAKDFTIQFTVKFREYIEHVISHWFLRSTKLEIWKPSEERKNILTFVTDFAENISVVAKKELGSQYFHRPEIMCFGAVADMTVEDGEGGFRNIKFSYIVTSDFKNKDSSLVYCCFEKILPLALQEARSRNIDIKLIIIKSDRPSSQYWNINMMKQNITLSEAHNIPLTHITEQSMHNKGLFIYYITKIITFILLNTPGTIQSVS